MFLDKSGKTYEYKEILPNGDVIHGDLGKHISERQRDRLNEIMSLAWDALQEEDKKEINKKEINKKMELKHSIINK